MLDNLRREHRRYRTLRDLSLWTMAVYHYGNWSNKLESSVARTITSTLYGGLFLLVEMSTGNTINREAKIGCDLHLVHSGNIRIHPDAVIGERCGIMHDVTIGTNMERVGAPVIGNDVFIGAGAKILGPVTIGDGARIAANSLVLVDVPAGCTAIGVPARVMRYVGSSATGTAPRPDADSDTARKEAV